jgi:histidinol dehydrogenase
VADSIAEVGLDKCGLVSNLLTPEEIELLQESKRRMVEEVREASEQMRKVKTSC